MNTRGIPVRYIGYLTDYLEKIGISGQQLYQNAGLSPALVDQPAARLRAEDLHSLFFHARQLSGQEALAFETGRAIRVTSHGLLGLGMLTSPDYEHALKMLSRHMHLVTTLFGARFQPVPGYGCFTYTPLTGMSPATLDFLLEMLAVSFQGQTETILGDRHEPFEIHLSMREPAHAHRYAELKPVRFFFNARTVPGIRIQLPYDLLSRPLPLADCRVAAEAEARCIEMLPPPDDGAHGWGAYMKMLLKASGGLDLSLADIAVRIKISVRTLERYLAREGLTFRELSGEVRFDMACELLQEPGSQVTQVAMRLGFSDASNFSRAFKRRFGCSPQEFREHITRCDGVLCRDHAGGRRCVAGTPVDAAAEDGLWECRT